MSQATGISFVIDFLELLPNFRTAAEYLYDLLTKASVVKMRIPILIVCNKTEKSTEDKVRFDVINLTRITFYPP